MPKAIDWLYFRKGCNTCKKAQAYFTKHQVATGEIVDAVKNRFDAAAALKLLKGIDRIVAAKGQKVIELSLKDRPDEETILGLLMGPTGNLRAPSSRVGHTLLVGFHPDAYAEVLGR